MGRFAGRLGAGQRDHALHRGGAQRRLAGLAGRIPQQAVDAGPGKAPLPAPHRRPADAGAPGDIGDRQPLGGVEDDSRPGHVLLGAIAIGDDRLETGTILSRDQRTDFLSHGGSISPSRPFVNPLNASVH